MTTPSVTFSNPDAAIYFLRQIRPSLPAGYLSGFMNHSAEWQLGKANAIAKRCTPERVAREMHGYRGKGLQFVGVRCDCCGTPLTNKDSVRLGRGPKCVEAMAG